MDEVISGVQLSAHPERVPRLELIREALHDTPTASREFKLAVDRLTLAKRRWRGIAEDGREFGFDLSAPLQDGAAVFREGDAVYFIAQKYEPVLEVTLAPNVSASARLGWTIGNLHFALEIFGETVRVADDPALRQLFAREGIAFTACRRVFHPLSGGHRH